jgi:SAM-dependent methyltransferase
MPVMSTAERWFCQSAPWRWTAGRLILGWALQGVNPRGAVLELGGGSGAMAAATIRRHPDISLTVTDVDPAMVTAAQRRFTGAPAVTVRRADATALPFADGSFDVVVSYLMLHHVIAWQRALAEVSRVLRPGGHFIGYDLVATPLTKAVHWADRSPHRLIGRHELAPALTQAGLEAVRVRPTAGRQAVRFTAVKPGGPRPQSGHRLITAIPATCQPSHRIPITTMTTRARSQASRCER